MIEFVARIAPIGRPVELVERDKGAIVEQFTAWTFLEAVEHPERVRLDLDHQDRDAVVLTGLHVIGNWWVARFQTNTGTSAGALAADRLHVGRAVSIGFLPRRVREIGQSGIREVQLADLLELSVVRLGAIPGAVVVSKLEVVETQTFPAEEVGLRQGARVAPHGAGGRPNRATSRPPGTILSRPS